MSFPTMIGPIRINNASDFNAVMRIFHDLGYKWHSGENLIVSPYRNYTKIFVHENKFLTSSAPPFDIDSIMDISFEDFLNEMGFKKIYDEDDPWGEDWGYSINYDKQKDKIEIIE